jgi:hypothetical protein
MTQHYIFNCNIRYCCIIGITTMYRHIQKVIQYTASS